MNSFRKNHLRTFSVSLLVALTLFSCVRAPKETVSLSKQVEKDLKDLHQAHRNMVLLYYSKLEDEINLFVDDTYAPFVIRYVLEHQWKEYNTNPTDTTSLYAIIIGAVDSDKFATEAIDVMGEFQEAALEQIGLQRHELISPIHAQRDSLLSRIDNSYNAVLRGQNAISNYLVSIQDVKKAQSEITQSLGFENVEEQFISDVTEISGYVSDALAKAKHIDQKSEQSFEQLQDVVNELKTKLNK